MEAKFTDFPEALWERVQVWIPKPRRRRKSGRPRVPDRLVMRGILYRLRTGCHWDAIPREFSSGSTCYRRFVEWNKAGVFKMMHVEALLYYDDKVGIEWDWTSLDSASVKAPKGGTSPGPIRPIARNSEPSAMSS